MSGIGAGSAWFATAEPLPHQIVRGPDAMLSLASIPLTVRISELYRGLFVLEAPTSSGNELSEVV
jgi:hypothetical protein